MTSKHEVVESISVFTTTETQWTGIDLSELKAKYASSVQGIDYWLKEFESQLNTTNDRYTKFIETKKLYFERVISELNQSNKELETLVHELQKSRESKFDFVEKLQNQLVKIRDKLKEKSEAVEIAKEELKKERDVQLQKINELEAEKNEKTVQLDGLKKELYEFSVKVNERQRENQQFQTKMEAEISSLQEKEEHLARQQKLDIQKYSQELNAFREENQDRQKRQKISVETKKKNDHQIVDNLQNEEETFRKETTTILSSWKSRNPSLTSKHETTAQEQQQLQNSIAHHTKLIRDLEDKLRQSEAAYSAEHDELHHRYVGVTQALRVLEERFEQARRNFEEIRKKSDQTSTRLGSTRDQVSPVKVILDNVRESSATKSKNIAAVTEELRERTLERETLKSKIKDKEIERTQLSRHTERSLEEVVPLRREKERLEFDTGQFGYQHKKNQKELTNQIGLLEKLQKQIQSLQSQIPSPQEYEAVRASLEKLGEKSDSAETKFGNLKSSIQEELRRLQKEIQTLQDEIGKKKSNFGKIQTDLEKKEHELEDTERKIRSLRDKFRLLETENETDLRNRAEEISSISQKREKTEATLVELRTKQDQLRTQYRQHREQQEMTVKELEKVREESKQIREKTTTDRRRRQEETRGLTLREKEVHGEWVEIKRLVDKKEEEIKMVHEKRKTIQIELEEYLLHVQELNSHISNKTSEIEHIIHEILELAPRQKRKLEEAKKEIFILKASINKRTQQHNEAALHLMEINKSLQGLNSKLDETLKELELCNIEKEKERFSDIRGKLSIANKEIEALRSDIEMRTSHYQEKIKLLDTTATRLESLTNERISLNGNLDPLKAEFLEQREFQKNLLEEQRKTEIERENISDELDKLRKEESRFRLELHELEEKLRIQTDIAEKIFFQFRKSQSELNTAKVELDTAVGNLRNSETQNQRLENKERTSRQSLEQAISTLNTLKEDLVRTTNNLEEIRNSLKSAEEKYSVWENNIENLELERKKTKKEISEFQSMIKKSRRELEEGGNEKERVEESIREFEKKISAKKEATGNIERQVQELGMKIERHQRLIETTNQNNSALLKKIESIDLQDLSQGISNARDDLEHWKNHYQQKCADYDRLTQNTNRENQKQNDTTEKINNLRKNIMDITSVENDQKNSRERLRSEYEQNKSERDILKKELFSVKSEVEMLNRQYEGSRTVLERKEEERDSLMARIASLSSEVELLKKERELEATRAQALSLENAALGREVDAHLGRIDILKSEQQELEILQRDIENLNHTLTNLKTTNRLLRTAVEGSTIISSVTDQLTQNHKELQIQKKSLKNEIEVVTKELKSLKDHIENLREQRKQDRRQITAMEHAERDLAVKRETQRRLVEDLEMQLTELEDFRDEFYASVVQRREFKEEYVRIEKQVHVWEENMETEAEMKNKIQFESVRLSHLAHQKKSLTDENQTTKNRISILEHRLDSLLSERDAQVARLEALQADLTAIKSERDVNLFWIETEHHRIQKALGSLRVQLGDRHMDLMERLRRCQKEYGVVMSQFYELEEKRNAKHKVLENLSTKNERTQMEVGKMRRKMGQLETTLEEYKNHIEKAEAMIEELNSQVKAAGKRPPIDPDVPSADTGSMAGKRVYPDEGIPDEDTKSETPSVKRPRLRIRGFPNTPHLPTQVGPLIGNQGSERKR